MIMGWVPIGMNRRHHSITGSQDHIQYDLAVSRGLLLVLGYLMMICWTDVTLLAHVFAKLQS